MYQKNVVICNANISSENPCAHQAHNPHPLLGTSLPITAHHRLLTKEVGALHAPPPTPPPTYFPLDHHCEKSSLTLHI